MIYEPFISVIIICYNYGHMINRALEAIAAQTFKDFELVFVNNGSTDNTAEVFKKFCAIHSNIRISYVEIEKNEGVAKGDNAGVDVAKGKYLLFHDADDWMDFNTLELLAKAAKRTDADRVIGAYRNVDEKGKIVREQFVAENPRSWLYTMQQANLFRADIYKKHVLPLRGAHWNDAEKALRFSRYGKTITSVREPCYNYLVHLDSTTRKKDIYKKLLQENVSFDFFIRCVIQDYKSADEETLRWLEFGMIHIYYSYLSIFLRDAPLSVKLQDSRQLQSVMKGYFPNYLKNPLIWKGKETGKSFRGRLLCEAMTTAERMHLLGLMMIGYHLVSKIHYVQIN